MMHVQSGRARAIFEPFEDTPYNLSGWRDEEAQKIKER